jgi:seryl-tRNA synthetase
MLDAAYVREHLAEVDARLRARGMDPSAELNDLAALDSERRRLIPLVENLKRDQNAAGDAVARAKKEGRDPSEIFVANKARSKSRRTRWSSRPSSGGATP